jgi:threonylcarbamoyladenosine tRNA methylthiotransferase MtaB
MRASFHTFGCKLNQFETEALASAFRSRGFSLAGPGEEAEVHLINTCTVTGRSEQKARRFIRGLARAHPAALLVVTGCYAQLEAGAIQALASNVTVVPQAEKSLLLELPRILQEKGGPAAAASLRSVGAAGEAGRFADPFAFQVQRFSFHSRAFLKVQDGCDHRCAYCRVPLARGGSRSLDPLEAARRARLLEQGGYREVVLTGVNLSSWRHEGEGLARLLRRLLESTSSIRLRLSSLEPETIKPELAEALSHPRVCAHFHLPVQSGSDRVLAAMRRRYRSAQVRRAVGLLRAARGEPFLAADLIAGFPGEGEEDFRATCELAESLGFAKLHVFPFSPRPGTAAAGMKGKVPERVRDARVRVLSALSGRLGAAYRSAWVGREVEVVLERRRSGGPGAESRWRGFSGNYLPCAVRGVPPGTGAAGSAAGRMVRARIEDGGDPCAALYLGAADHGQDIPQGPVYNGKGIRES